MPKSYRSIAIADRAKRRRGVFTPEPEPEPVNGMAPNWAVTTSLKEKRNTAGRTLDCPAPSLISHVPDGYGEIGLQSSGMDFSAKLLESLARLAQPG